MTHTFTETREERFARHLREALDEGNVCSLTEANSHARARLSEALWWAEADLENKKKEAARES